MQTTLSVHRYSTPSLASVETVSPPLKDQNSSPVPHAELNILSSQGVPGPCNDTRICISGGTGGGCIKDGPFKDQIVHMGPWNDTGTNRNDQCLKRSFNPAIPKEFWGPAALNHTFSQTTFEDFWPALEGFKFSGTYPGQHATGHGGVGGVVRWLLLPFLPVLEPLVQEP